MKYSLALENMAQECNQLFRSFRSGWIAIKSDWKDQQRRKFEQAEVSTILSAGGQLMYLLDDLCSIVQELERQGFILD